MKRIVFALLMTTLILTGAGWEASAGPGGQADPFRGYLGVIKQAASQYNVDPSLIAAIIQQSSAFDPKARDAAGGQGLMLLMPETARALGVANPYDPEQNVTAGAQYLASLLKRYDGDVSKAVAAYNAGPGAVDQHGGVPPNQETQEFVSRVLGYQKQFAPQILLQGTWKSDWGPVTLNVGAVSADGSASVTGSWNQGEGKIGRFTSGSFNAQTGSLTLYYYESWVPLQGNAQLELSGDKQTLSGTWAQPGGSGSWTMTR